MAEISIIPKLNSPLSFFCESLINFGMSMCFQDSSYTSMSTMTHLGTLFLCVGKTYAYIHIYACVTVGIWGILAFHIVWARLPQVSHCSTVYLRLTDLHTVWQVTLSPQVPLCTRPVIWLVPCHPLWLLKCIQGLWIQVTRLTRQTLLPTGSPLCHPLLSIFWTTDFLCFCFPKLKKLSL